MTELRILGENAKAASRLLAKFDTAEKNASLLKMADALITAADKILDANARDVAAAREKGISEALLDRLTLTSTRITAMADDMRRIAALPDPVGEVMETITRPNGLTIEKVRVPMGVAAIIYESRPNVTADAASLCLKTANAVILKGGSDALYSNIAISDALRDALLSVGFPPDAIQLVKSTDRESTKALMQLRGYVDVLIPRGSRRLIQNVVENATVPIIETGTGNCHIYIDNPADLAMGVSVIVNAKAQRPGVCNAAETLLVHRDIAAEFLPLAEKALKEAGVSLRGCPKTCALIDAEPATEADYATEFLDLILAIRVVDSFAEALSHIAKYSTGHSEAIITNDAQHAEAFLAAVDAAAVYVNASTRFTDGGEFGFGAEIGISTQKLHARGPMGLREMCAYKYKIRGTGQIR